MVVLILPNSPYQSKRADFRRQMNVLHLQCRHAEASTPDRTARLRGSGTSHELQESGSRALRDADGSQPPDTAARAILRTVAFPSSTPSVDADGGRSALVSYCSRRA